MNSIIIIFFSLKAFFSLSSNKNFFLWVKLALIGHRYDKNKRNRNLEKSRKISSRSCQDLGNAAVSSKKKCFFSKFWLLCRAIETKFCLSENFWAVKEAFVNKSKTWKTTKVPANFLETLVWLLKNPRSCVDLEMVSWKSKILRGLGVDVVGSSTGLPQKVKGPKIRVQVAFLCETICDA